MVEDGVYRGVPPASPREVLEHALHPFVDFSISDEPIRDVSIDDAAASAGFERIEPCRSEQSYEAFDIGSGAGREPTEYRRPARVVVGHPRILTGRDDVVEVKSTHVLK